MPCICSRFKGKISKQGAIGFVQPTYASNPALPLTLDQALGMADFYCRFVRPGLGRFSRFMLKNLAKELGKDIPSQRQQVGRLEAMRFIWALYIFLCHVAKEAGFSSRGQLVKPFLTIPKPWEIEQLYVSYQISRPHIRQISRLYPMGCAPG